jgi:hypothetical protein
MLEANLLVEDLKHYYFAYSFLFKKRAQERRAELTSLTLDARMASSSTKLLNTMALSLQYLWLQPFLLQVLVVFLPPLSLQLSPPLLAPAYQGKPNSPFSFHRKQRPQRILELRL